MRAWRQFTRTLLGRVGVPFVLVSFAAVGLLVVETSSRLRDQQIEGAADRATTKVNAIELSAIIDPAGGVVEAVTSFASPRDIRRIIVFSGTPSKVIASSRFDDVGLYAAQVPGDPLALLSLLAQFDRSDEGARRYIARHGDRVDVAVLAQISLGGSVFDEDNKTIVVVSLTVDSAVGTLALVGGAMRNELAIVATLLSIVALVFRQQVLKPIRRLGAAIENGTLEDHCDYFVSRGNEFGGLAQTLMRSQFLRDVSESESTASRARLEAIIQNAPDAIVTVDGANRVEEFNAAAERIFDMRYEDVYRTNARYLFDDDRDSLDSSDGLIESPEKYKFGIELVGVSASGRRFPVWATASETMINGQVMTTLILRDMSAVRDAEARLAHTARHDSLTGLPNRWLLIDRTQAAFRRPRHSGEILALICLDLDRFKVVNDSLGHAVGDRLLIETARRLLKCAADSDTVARLGGDEFAVMIEAATNMSAVIDLAERIREEISEGYDMGSEAFVGASIGIAIWDGETFDAMSLLKAADTAMYRAKDAGRDCFRIFDQKMQEAVSTRQSIETALKHGVERREFVLHYQPIIDLTTGCVTKTEALIRWNRPGLGLVQPGEFISIAEDTGLITSIGAWVVDEACRQCALWHAEGFEIGVAVNVSGRQLVNADIVTVLDEATRRHGCRPADLTLEITESMLIAEPTQALEILNALKRLGVAISLDDFGTGFSSLTYLRRFPVDVLKIDQSFIEAIGTDDEDTAIVAAIVNLARSLRLKIVAEGVQSQDHIAALLALGCGYAQGYWFSEPIDADSLREFAAQRAS